MENIRVLHVSANQYSELSTSHHTKRIWEELAKGCEEYHVLARAKDNKFHLSREGNIFLHLVPSVVKRQWIFFFSSIYLFHLIRKYHINRILAQCPIMGGYFSAIASKVFKVPLMVEIHGEEYFNYFKNKNILHTVLSGLQRFTFQSATVVRSLSEKMTFKLNKNGISKNVVIIPNRVDTNLFSPTKKDYAINGPLKLVSVGRFVKAKDYESLINIIAEFPFKVELTLIGGGILKDKYLKIIKEKNLEGNVVLIDWIEQKEMINLITSNDIYIQTSISEGMPRTILEAMALRMPIITTNVGSIEGVVIGDKNGILIEPNKPDAIIDAVCRLQNSQDLRERLAQNAFESACHDYEWNKSFEKYRNTLYSMNDENSTNLQ